METGKAAAREAARARRRAIPPAERAQRAERMVDHFVALPETQAARTVGCYVSIGSEMDTSLLLRRLLVEEKRVVVPVVQDDAMVFARLEHPWALVPGPRNIPVPRQPWTEVDGNALDVLAVPGLQFGRDGSRLGQGGGYFDRWLKEHVNPLRVGLAFAEQVVDSVPTETHDEAMDVIVTEEGVLRVGR